MLHFPQLFPIGCKRERVERRGEERRGERGDETDEHIREHRSAVVSPSLPSPSQSLFHSTNPPFLSLRAVVATVTIFRVRSWRIIPIDLAAFVPSLPSSTLFLSSKLCPEIYNSESLITNVCSWELLVRDPRDSSRSSQHKS